MQSAIRTDYSDSELKSLIKFNDKRVFCHLFNNYGWALLSCIRELINDDHIAEDILQDVFVKIWTKIEYYDSEKACLYTWMRRIAENTSIDYLRGGINNRSNRTNDNKDSIKNIPHCTEQKTEKIGLNQLIDKLPESHKFIICMVYYGGYTFKEIAEIMGIPLGTVKTRSRSALTSLRKEFA